VANRKPHKNIARVLEAYSASSISSEIRLVLTGIGDRDTNERIRQLGIENRVVFAGDVPESLIGSYYRGALITIMASLYEGFGLPVLESMACGTPVIASAIPPFREIAEDAVLFVNPMDVMDIAKAIDFLSSCAEERSRLAEKGIRRARAFSWDITTEKVRQVLIDAHLEHNL
jgi:glycosyltransferase involved in cell wall biosynthesis